MRALLRVLPRLVARIPAAVHTKLLVAFLIVVGLFIALGAVGLGVLGGLISLLLGIAPVQKTKEPWPGAGRFRAMPPHGGTSMADSVS